MTKNLNLTMVIIASAIITFSSCKTNENVVPTITTKSSASLPTLKLYLTRMLNVKDSEIKYDTDSKEFVINDNIKLKMEQVQATYSIANEYKLRYNIQE